MIRYYEYRQNNSGGYFSGPAMHVFVEVNKGEGTEEADRLAKRFELYFGGEGDCECCGDRWSNAYGSPDSVESLAELISIARERNKKQWDRKHRSCLIILASGATVLLTDEGKQEFRLPDGKLSPVMVML